MEPFKVGELVKVSTQLKYLRYCVYFLSYIKIIKLQEEWDTKNVKDSKNSSSDKSEDDSRYFYVALKCCLTFFNSVHWFVLLIVKINLKIINDARNELIVKKSNFANINTLKLLLALAWTILNTIQT